MRIILILAVTVTIFTAIGATVADSFNEPVQTVQERVNAQYK